MVNNETKESTIKNDRAEKKPKGPKKKFFERRSAWFLIAIILVVLLLAAGGVTGAARGINDRINMAETQAAPKIQAQIESARQDLEEGRFEVALSRLDWILEEMSQHLSEEELAEVGELYSQALLLQTSYQTPTPQPSPTPTEPVYTPTPDLRGAEDLFNAARGHIASQEWDEAVRTLEILRELNIEYRTVHVDGLLYVALRNRGIRKILAEGSLEPGIYDLTLAERFAPLDTTAEGLRTWTRLYQTGASYWEVDWAQVVFYFEQVYPHLPNLRDGTNMTATERYRIGAIEYGSQLAAAGEFCEAQEYFRKAMSISDDPVAQPTAQWVAEECWNIQNPTPEPPPPSPQPTEVENGDQVPTQEPTPTPTPIPDDENGNGE